jgi:hypothetical protein
MPGLVPGIHVFLSVITGLDPAIHEALLQFHVTRTERSEIRG